MDPMTWASCYAFVPSVQCNMHSFVCGCTYALLLSSLVFTCNDCLPVNLAFTCVDTCTGDKLQRRVLLLLIHKGKRKIVKYISSKRVP